MCQVISMLNSPVEEENNFSLNNSTCKSCKVRCRTWFSSCVKCFSSIWSVKQKDLPSNQWQTQCTQQYDICNSRKYPYPPKLFLVWAGCSCLPSFTFGVWDSTPSWNFQWLSREGGVWINVFSRIADWKKGT